MALHRVISARSPYQMIGGREPKRRVQIKGISGFLRSAQDAGECRAAHHGSMLNEVAQGTLLGSTYMSTKDADLMQAKKFGQAKLNIATLVGSRSFRSYDSGQDIFRDRARSHDIVAARSKRAFDFCIALAFLLTLAPALLLIAALVKGTSRGPALFRQRRYGTNGQLFEIWKFRTMYMTLGDQHGVRQTRDNDPRVTPFGRFLRRTSLDELPQMVNVLTGDMSLIGPRPHVPGMLAGGVLYEDLVPIYHQRHVIRPGITGLAQVSGFRGSTEDAEHAKARVDHDLLYIETWSFILDLRILFRTVWRELTGGTGY